MSRSGATTPSLASSPSAPSLRHNLLAQPELVGLVHRQGHTGELFQPVREALVRELHAAGVDGHDADLASLVIINHTSGSVLNDVQIAWRPRSTIRCRSPSTATSSSTTPSPS